ncbi:MAG: hypothetical protein AAGC97_18600, partial [Planctomycetota bacterium]
LHAVQGKLTGTIRFHGKGFHHDWITNWTNPRDQIDWDIRVVEPGDYHVSVKYTCPKSDVGSQIRISVDDQDVTAIVEPAYDPDRFPNRDRAPRTGELEKPWATLDIGTIYLNEGVAKLTLSADTMPGTQVMDVREVTLSKITDK